MRLWSCNLRLLLLYSLLGSCSSSFLYSLFAYFFNLYATRLLVMSMQSSCLEGLGGEKELDPRLQETTLIQQIFGGRLRSKVKVSGLTFFTYHPIYSVWIFYWASLPGILHTHTCTHACTHASAESQFTCMPLYNGNFHMHLCK